MMAITANSINDGEGRYGSRTRVNRLVYEFTALDLAAQSTVSADVKINGKVNNIIVDPTRSVLQGGGAVTDGSIQLLMADLTDGAGTPALYRYHEQITQLDYTAACPEPYIFQTSEGAASADGTQAHGNHLVIFSGKASGAAQLPKTRNKTGAQTVMDDVVPWTGLVAGTVRIKLDSATVWDPATGSIFVVITYE